jgi:hypothetical protein
MSRTRVVLMMTAVAVFAMTGGAACRSKSPVQPDGTSCGLGPVQTPDELAASCVPAASGCPYVRPANARTLVSVATCDEEAGSSPCTPAVSVCPFLDPNDKAYRFAVPTPGDTSGSCPSLVDLRFQSSGDGGVGIEWSAFERGQTAQGCGLVSPTRIGIASVSGACCSTSVDIPMPAAQRTFRFTVQADWQQP